MPASPPTKPSATSTTPTNIPALVRRSAERRPLNRLPSTLAQYAIRASVTVVKTRGRRRVDGPGSHAGWADCRWEQSADRRHPVREPTREAEACDSRRRGRIRAQSSDDLASHPSHSSRHSGTGDLLKGDGTWSRIAVKKVHKP